MAKGKYEYWLTEEGLMLIEGWCRMGLVETDLCKNMGISLSSLSTWKNQFPQILDALKKGKEVSDMIVENALFKNATGYTYEEEVAIKVKSEEYVNGKKVSKESVETVTLKKYRQPETTAQIFWLTNRKNQYWKHVNRQEIVMPEPIKVDLSNVTNDELKNVERILSNVKVE